MGNSTKQAMATLCQLILKMGPNHESECWVSLCLTFNPTRDLSRLSSVEQMRTRKITLGPAEVARCEEVANRSALERPRPRTPVN